MLLLPVTLTAAVTHGGHTSESLNQWRNPILEERDWTSITSSIEISSEAKTWKKSNAWSWSASPLGGCLKRTRTRNPLIGAPSTMAMKTATILSSATYSLRYARFTVWISETLNWNIQNPYRYVFCSFFSFFHSRHSIEIFWVVAS